MEKTICTKVYSFDKLSDEAKDKAREWYREGALDYEWYDGDFEDAKEIGKILGITIDKIYFSGFSSQGDGAQFVGNYEYVKQSINKIKEYAPQDAELHRIALELFKVQKVNFYNIKANVAHSGHYQHEMCTDISVETYNGDWASKETTEAIKELLRDFMNWIYKQLERQYDYLNSNESVDETILANEYTFTESGERYG